jgi:hypothetical protein
MYSISYKNNKAYRLPFSRISYLKALLDGSPVALTFCVKATFFVVFYVDSDLIAPLDPTKLPNAGGNLREPVFRAIRLKFPNDDSFKAPRAEDA